MDSAGSGVLHSADKAAVFLDQFSPLQPPSLALDQAEVEYVSYVQHRIVHPDPISPLCRPFSHSELNSALMSLKSNAVGSDKISNKMLTNLSSSNRSSLLHMFNVFLSSGFVPPHWKTSIIIPLLKPSKPPDKHESYRPISLTSCLCKVFERLVNARLQWHLDAKNILPPFQAGFRTDDRRSTVDHIVTLDCIVKDGLNNSVNTYAIS